MSHHHEEVSINLFDLLGYTAKQLTMITTDDLVWVKRQLMRKPHKDTCVKARIVVKRSIKLFNKLESTRHDFKANSFTMAEFRNEDNENDRCIAFLGWLFAKLVNHEKLMEQIENDKESMDNNQYVFHCRFVKITYLLKQLPAVECVVNHLVIGDYQRR